MISLLVFGRELLSCDIAAVLTILIKSHQVSLPIHVINVGIQFSVGGIQHTVKVSRETAGIRDPRS